MCLPLTILSLFLPPLSLISLNSLYIPSLYIYSLSVWFLFHLPTVTLWHWSLSVYFILTVGQWPQRRQMRPTAPVSQIWPHTHTHTYWPSPHITLVQPVVCQWTSPQGDNIQDRFHAGCTLLSHQYLERCANRKLCGMHFLGKRNVPVAYPQSERPRHTVIHWSWAW